MPAILTESGFMDNMTEAVDMLDTNFQQAEEETTCKEKDVEVNTDIKYVRVIYDGLLNVRKCPSWNDDVVVGTVKKDEVFTVMKKVKVEDSYMYKLKSGLYITASSKYVEGLKSI